MDIPLSEISDFPNHPFKVKSDEAMLEMADSVKQYGVLVPGLVRPKADGGYEMIAGHRRKKASELAGKETMPCIVREMNDDEAILAMVDSNLQRESISPSEKAFAYKMKLEAMKCQGQRTDLTSRPVVGKLESADALGENTGESGRQIQRYIRLTELNPSILQMVDDKQMDLLAYLQHYEPQELVHFSGNVYTTRSHGSLKISNGKWCWWSRGIGGRSALDYLIKVRGMTLPEAVMRIDEQAVMPSARSKAREPAKPGRLLLPEKNKSNDRVVAYLKGRGIHITLIDYCIQTGRLYESRYRHNAVFVGFDPRGVPRYGALRGTSGSRFMGDVSGSNKHFSFSIPARDKSTKLHLFESAIDLLSHGTLELLSGRDWRQENCLSLAGIYKPKKNIEESAPPAALIQYLKDCPQITEIALHLDNDAAGRLAAETIKALLASTYTISDEPPKRGQDYNDYLRIVLRIRQPNRMEK